MWLSDNKLSNNNLGSELVESKSFFKLITIEEIEIFMIAVIIELDRPTEATGLLMGKYWPSYFFASFFSIVQTYYTNTRQYQLSNLIQTKMIIYL